MAYSSTHSYHHFNGYNFALISQKEWPELQEKPAETEGSSYIGGAPKGHKKVIGGMGM